MDNNIALETKFVSAIKGTFYIPDYQRGYRWGKDEVQRLLDDIYSNGKKDYYLQPIVVRRMNNGLYELIDGQQRLTTLFLIYRYKQNTDSSFSGPAFSLEYKTREKSKEFLEKIDFTRRKENIDFWFIANAYQTIKSWFEADSSARDIVFTYLAQNVKIIWYEVGEREDPVSLFTRLNIGKIPLTNAELIKAMFLSSNGAVRERQKEIALQWDNMERELHQDSFWYFLTNNTEDYQTRIDLILELMAKKPKNNSQKYYTFFTLSKHIDELKKHNKNIEKELDNLWEKIQHTFLTLKDWYEDFEFYHKIGYLISSEHLTLQEIFEKSKKKKSEFRKDLNEYIRSSIALKDRDYRELDYHKDYERIKRLLLLFNVESVRQKQEQRFPFDKFKAGGKGKNFPWSLEHIHAQQSEGLAKQKEWKEWLYRHIDSVLTVTENTTKEIQEEGKKLAAEMTQKSRAEYNFAHKEDFEILQKKVIKILSTPEDGQAEGGRYVDSISNLALLRLDNNIVLSNSTFSVKRNKIIEMDKNGEYIPFCTRMVFLKYYTQSNDNQLHFWGEKDRNAYEKQLGEVLKSYLPTATNTEAKA